MIFFRKLNEIKTNSEEYLQLLERLEELEEKTETVKREINEKAKIYRQIRNNYDPKEDDTNIQRLLYKINFSQQLSLILLSTMSVESVEDSKNILKLTKKLSTVQDVNSYRKKLQDNKTELDF